MLTDNDIEKIKQKMKDNYIHCATLAKRWGVSRQCVWLVLNKKGTSKNIEEKLKNFLREK